MDERRRKGKFSRMLFVLFLVPAFVSLYASAFAYDEDAAEDDPTNMKLESAMAQKRDKSPIIKIKERVESQRPKPTLPEGKTLIRDVKVIGSTIIAKRAIIKLRNVNKNRELTGKDMQRIADKITRAYSRHGYITSYASIIPDKLAEGVLEISCVEGKVGKIEFQGNKYFSTDLLRKKITLQEGQLFNFTQLSTDIYRMNRNMDRKVNIQLDPSKTQGYTDITLNVKDKLPMHATLQADNYGADTILYQRYKLFLIDNNLTKHDDSLTVKVEWARGDAHKIYDLDYVIPINNTWKYELYYMPYKSEDYYEKDNETTDFEKRARKFYMWLYQSLVNKPDLEIVSSYGFTYMDIFWYKPYIQYNNMTREDRFRIFKWDMSFNRADKYGRWVITNDLQKAVADMWGGSPTKSDGTSVAGSKGDYVKNLLTVARRQKLGAGIDFLGKARWQNSSATLTGVNDFSAGGYCGVIDNRGFPRTQAPADGGRALNLGFSFPAYFIPKNVKVPYSKTKFYDALQLFTFWDWSQSVIKSPKFGALPGDPDQKKITTLRSAGLGLTFAVPDQSLSVRIDYGFPLSHQDSKDERHNHLWWSVTKTY